MQKFIDKLIERLEEAKDRARRHYNYGNETAYLHSIEIINQLAEEYIKKQEYEVWLNGCDDDTIFKMEMTNYEYEFLERVSEMANETSTYSCMPRLFLDKSVKYIPPYTEGE